MKLGWSSPPHAGNAQIGAQVFVFFEGGDINYPIYFAFAQSGPGWLSEHPNQHVFKSDNVRIRIDENVKDDRSTTKFDSYNSKNSKVAKANLERDCTKHGWTFDQEKGVIKDLETRIDIEVLAENLNAINLNIHGNVNMRLDGNWFVEHYGNKYEYHEGDTYIKQIGSTYIEQEGTVRIKHEGNKSVEHIGNYYLTHNGDTMQTHTGSYFMMVDGDVTFTFNSEYKLTVGKNYTETVMLSKNADIFGSKNLNIYDSYKEVIANNKFISAEGSYDLLVGESITSKSSRGNILLETEGNFELTKDGKITPVGFTNIGTKGNIEIISTFGNINVQCKKDDSKAQFNKKSVVIPWNPGFVKELEKYATMFPVFNTVDSIMGAEALNSTIDFLNFDFAKFLELFKQFTTSLLIYDGLPVFLPTRMIVQNPNIPIPNNTEDVSWIPNFRSEASNWKTISPSDYWKLPGRLMGNINIQTWSGDINIKTNSELGCAGNITIEATESAGTLPGYKIGTVNIKNEGRKRIYPDPRDLFLDSDFTSRMNGQLKLFTHGTNFLDTFRRSVLPTTVSVALQETTGFSFNWVATNYDDFYKIYGLQSLTRGNIGQPLSPIKLQQSTELLTKKGPKLGCPKCISDYLLGIPGIQDVCYASEKFEKIASDGFHSYGFFKFNPFDRDNPRGTFNIQSLDFDKISLGDGHAIDMGFVNKEFVGPNIGAFNLSSSGDFNHTVGRNYSFKCNTSTTNGKKILNYTYTEKWYDDVWPTSFAVPFNLLNSAFSNGISSAGSLNQNGNIKISKVLGLGTVDVKTAFKFLGGELPHNKFMVIGYTVKNENNIGTKLSNIYEEGFESSINLGFDLTNIYEILNSPNNLNNRSLTFTDHIFTKNTINSTTNIDKKIEEINRSLVLGLSPASLPLSINVKKSYNYSNIKVENSALNSVNYGNDNLDVLSGINEFKLSSSAKSEFPKIEFKINDFSNKIIGHGYDKNTNYISYLKFEKDKNKADETYIDYNEYELKSVTHDLPNNAGSPRNIILSGDILAGWNVSSMILVNSNRSNSQDITWKSAINKQILSLISDKVFVDKTNDKQYGINNIKVNLLGNSLKSDNNPVVKYNAIAYEAKDFPVNEIFINNGRITNNSSNKIEVNNGLKTEKSKNEIFINNGKEVKESLNNIKIENGTYSTGVNNNRYVIVNGFEGGNGTHSVYDIYNGNKLTSLKFDVIQPDKATITEYSANTKISNIGVLEQKNVGQTQNIKIGNAQTLDIGSTQKTIIGTSKTIDVPTYTFNTINMAMNNQNSTSIKTLTYSLNCTNCRLTAVTSYILSAGSISTTAIGTYLNTAGGAYTTKVGGAISMLAGGAGTFNAGGNVKIGSAKSDGKTNITGLFEATGHLTGQADGTPGEHSVVAKPSSGVSGTSVSVSVPSLEAPIINNPASFPGVETPKTPYTFTKILQLYVEYLKEEFNYLINIFR